MMLEQEFYLQVCRSMPVPCCDLLITDTSGRVLLLRRKNPPAQGQWWFPGGRILYLETRMEACLRILRQECGLHAAHAQELGTFDVLIDNPATGSTHHGVTTLYGVRVEADAPVRLDEQSIEHGWRTPLQWSREQLHAFVSEGMRLLDRME